MRNFLMVLGATVVIAIIFFLRGRTAGTTAERKKALDERLDQLEAVANENFDSEMARRIVDRITAFRERVRERADAREGGGSS